MSEKRRKIRIGDLGEIITGKTPSSGESGAFGHDGLNFITPKDMEGQKWILKTERSLGTVVSKSLRNLKIPKRSVIVSCIGSDMGKVAMTKKESVTNQQINSIVIDESKCSSEYIYYVLSQLQDYFKQLSGGSATPILNKSLFSKIEIKIFDKEIQDKIVEILRPLDEKIELNNQINETLEQMAQGLFKSWFVDFEPVRAKAEAVEAGNNPELAAMQVISGKSIEELERFAQSDPEAYQELAHTASLFPSEFVESELGMIPMGWEVKPFGENLKETIGGDWGQDEQDDKHNIAVRIIRGTDIPNVLNGNLNKLPCRWVQKSKFLKRKLHEGDIVFEISGGTKTQAVGRSLFITKNILKYLEKDVVPASFCRKFTCISFEVGNYLSYHLKEIYTNGEIWKYQQQSTGITNFQTTYFLGTEKVAIPSDTLLIKFSSLVELLESTRKTSENIMLEKTRDTLLPKLLSGEIEI